MKFRSFVIALSFHFSELHCPCCFLQIIRRSGPDEKYLCVARKRPGHFCDAAYIVMVIVAWEGVVSEQAESLYGYLVSTLTKNGFETERRCGTNERSVPIYIYIMHIQ